MGVNFPKTLLLVQLNKKETTTQVTSQNELIWKQPSMEDQEAIKKAKAKSFNTIKRRRRNSLTIKKRPRSRSSTSARIEQRFGTLRNLVPNTKNDENGDEASIGALEQLFTQTADYILLLQTRVRLMKSFVDILSGSSPSHDHDHDHE